MTIFSRIRGILKMGAIVWICLLSKFIIEVIPNDISSVSNVNIQLVSFYLACVIVMYCLTTIWNVLEVSYKFIKSIYIKKKYKLVTENILKNPKKLLGCILGGLPGGMSFKVNTPTKKQLDKYKAAKLTEIVWRYIADYELQEKGCLPPRLFKRIRDLLNRCPLCEYQVEHVGDCDGCILKNCGIESSYYQWKHSSHPITSASHARTIVTSCQRWLANPVWGEDNA